MFQPNLVTIMTLSFLNMPSELRGIIYENVLISALPIEICICKGSLCRSRPPVGDRRSYYYGPSNDPNEQQLNCPHVAPGLNSGPHTAILATNRQLYSETRPILYAKNCFVIYARRMGALRTFLQRIGNRNASAIRHLCIPFPFIELHPAIKSQIRASGRLYRRPSGRELMRSSHAPDIIKSPDSSFIPHEAATTVLGMINECCTGLDTLEMVVGTLSMDYFVYDLGVQAQAITFLVKQLWSSIPWVQRIIFNLYDDEDKREWVAVQSLCQGAVVRYTRREGITSVSPQYLKVILLTPDSEQTTDDLE